MKRVAKTLLWLSVALVASWLLLPVAVESLDAALTDLEVLAEEMRAAGAAPVEVLKLLGGAVVLAALWRHATPKSMRGRGSRKVSYRRR